MKSLSKVSRFYRKHSNIAETGHHTLPTNNGPLTKEGKMYVIKCQYAAMHG